MSKQYISQFQMPDGSIAHLKDADVPSVDTVLDKNSNNPISNAAVTRALENFKPGEDIRTPEVQYPDVPDMPTPYLIIGPEKIYEPIQDEWHDFSYPYTTGDSNWMTFGFMRANGSLEIQNLEIRHAETGALLYSQKDDANLFDGSGSMSGSGLPYYAGMYYFGYYNNTEGVHWGPYKGGLSIASLANDINSRLVIVKSGTYIGEGIPTIISGQWIVRDFTPNRSLYCLQWLKTPGLYKIVGDGKILPLTYYGDFLFLDVKTAVVNEANNIVNRYFTIFTKSPLIYQESYEKTTIWKKEVSGYYQPQDSNLKYWDSGWIVNPYSNAGYYSEKLTGEIYRGYPVYSKYIHYGVPINGAQMEVLPSGNEITVIRHHGTLGRCSLPYDLGASSYSAHSYTNGRKIFLKCTDDWAVQNNFYAWSELVEYIKKENLY